MPARKLTVSSIANGYSIIIPYRGYEIIATEHSTDIYKDGAPVFRKPGAYSGEALASAFNRVERMERMRRYSQPKKVYRK